MDLASDSLDVESLPTLGADAKIFSDLDLSLSLKAGSLHIARVAEAEIDSGSMSLKATKTGPNVTLERLSVTGLDGAAVDIQGAIGSRLDCGDGPFDEPIGCTISPCSFRVSRQVIGAGFWSNGQASFRRRRSPSTRTAGRRRWRGSRHRLVEGQWNGRRNSVRNRARSAVEGQRRAW